MRNPNLILDFCCVISVSLDMATSTFKWNAIKGLAMRAIGNKFTERVVMKIFAFRDTDFQTWAAVANPILEAAHVSIDDVADSQLKVRSATLILQVAQSKISHLFSLASKFEVQGKCFKISITTQQNGRSPSRSLLIVSLFVMFPLHKSKKWSKRFVRKRNRSHGTP